MHIIIINGPNLNLTGKREKGIYGEESFERIIENLSGAFIDHRIDYFQSNVEGEIINKLHETGFSCDGILLNAGGYTHTSVAIGDAVKAIDAPVIEVHMSNIFAREEFRHKSFISEGAKGVICGFGASAYRLGIMALLG